MAESQCDLRIQVMNGEYGICQRAVTDPPPSLFETQLSQFLTLSYTPDEISIVAPISILPDGKIEPGWRCLRIADQLEFNLVGIIARISRVLADQDIPVFVISTFGTDYFLIKNRFLEPALAALRKNGIEETTDSDL